VRFNIGDVFEWIAGSCFTIAAYLGLGAPAAIAVGGVFLFYQAQCYSGYTLQWLRRTKPPTSIEKSQEQQWPE
jgi:hypothetical protein